MFRLAAAAILLAFFAASSAVANTVYQYSFTAQLTSFVVYPWSGIQCGTTPFDPFPCPPPGSPQGPTLTPTPPLLQPYQPTSFSPGTPFDVQMTAVVAPDGSLRSLDCGPGDGSFAWRICGDSSVQLSGAATSSSLSGNWFDRVSALSLDYDVINGSGWLTTYTDTDLELIADANYPSGFFYLGVDRHYNLLAPVPVPGALPLLLGGLAIAGFALRRRRTSY